MTLSRSGKTKVVAFKINDFIKAGVNCTVFLADWHTLINDKLGGDWETISQVSQYYKDAFKLVCPSANIVLGTDLYDSRKAHFRHRTPKKTMLALPT